MSAWKKPRNKKSSYLLLTINAAIDMTASIASAVEKPGVCMDSVSTGVVVVEGAGVSTVIGGRVVGDGVGGVATCCAVAIIDTVPSVTQTVSLS
jgi:hypothetical protein